MILAENPIEEVFNKLVFVFIAITRLTDFSFSIRVAKSISLRITEPEAIFTILVSSIIFFIHDNIDMQIVVLLSFLILFVPRLVIKRSNELYSVRILVKVDHFKI